MRRLSAVLSFLLVLGVVAPSLAGAATQVCDQPDNTVLFCRPTANPCVISQTFDVPGGCALDFGARDVSFQGDFNVDSAVLTVHAHKIVIDGRVAGRPASGRGGSLFFSSDTTINMTTRGRIDVTGNSAGLMRLTAAGAITFVNGSQLNAKGSPSTASGGSIDMFAGGAILDDAAIDLSAGTGGGGGALNMQAGTTLSVTEPIAAGGGFGDGGDVDLAAADDATVTRAIDVSSINAGSGGSIRIRGGIDSIPGNQKPGGTLTVTANLTADGSSDSQGGYDGGDIALGAFGDLLFNGTVHATGGSPDGSAGSFAADSSDNVLNAITERDGALRVQGSIILRGSGVDSDGGDTDLDSGTDLFLDASIDATGGSTGGDTTLTSSRDTTINGTIASDATADGGAGGSISVKSGNVAFGTLTVGATANFTTTAVASGTGGDALLSGCNLSVAPNVLVDTTGPGARVDLAAVGTFNVGAGGRYLANPTGKVFLTHPPGLPPTVGAGVVFQTGRVDNESTTSGLYPVCPVCGDGIVEGPEVCDDNNTADGDCCNSTCSAFTCPTPTPTATPTRTRTPTPTKSGTPTVTASVTPVVATETATATVTPTPTLTPTATGPTPSPTGPTPTATTTPTVTATATLSATPTTTVTGTGLAATKTTTPTSVQTPALPLIAAKVLIKCQSALGKATTRFVFTEESTLESCGLAAFTCIQHSSDGAKRTSCLATARSRCASKFARIEAARGVFNETFSKSCGGAPPQVPFELLDATEGLSFNDAATACRNDVGVALTSTAAIASCVQFGSSCELERSVAIAAPRLADLLSSFVDVGALGLCVPPPSGNLDGLVDPNLGKGALRCEKTMLAAGRTLLKQQLATASACVDSLFKCRVSGKDCSRFAARCDTRLQDLRTSALAKFTSSVSRSCGPLPAAAVLDAAGLGFDSAGDRCAELGVPGVADANGAAACVARAYGCAGSAILRYALPMIDDELARAGLTLGNDFFCSASSPTATATPIVVATPTATATPVVTSTPVATETAVPTPTETETSLPSATPSPTVTPEETASPTETVIAATPTADVPTPTFVPTPAETETAAPPTPTATPLAPTPSATLVETPVPSPTATAAAGECGNGVVDPGEQCDFGDTDPGDGCDEHCQFETLIPGGGSRAQDCIAEWAVINPMNDPFTANGEVNARQTCLDGDPSCDADAVVNDECRFRMAICFTARDPNLPECTATAALTRYRLLEPLPAANDPSGTANAMALMSAIQALTGVAPTGNQFLFDPAFLAVPPDNCTEPFEVVVPLGGQLTQTEHFGTRTFSQAEPGKTATGDDSDDLRLVCRRP